MKVTPLTLEEIKSLVTQYVTEEKLSNSDFIISRENVAGLLDKIGKITMLSQRFVDKLEILDREFLSYGKTIEEWCQDLTMPMDYDPTGANALAPYDPSYRPPFYSYTLGKKVIPTTRRFNDLERAVHNDGELVELISSILANLYNSEKVWRYSVKREILGKIATMADIIGGGYTDGNYTTQTEYEVGTYLTNDDGTEAYIVYKPIPATNVSTLAQAVYDGKLIKLNLMTKIAEVTDTASGEAFVKQLKKDIEIASDNSQGYSLNGNAVGATEGLVLFVKFGVMPTIDVDVLAGAFNQNRVAVPAEIIPVPDFGSADSNDVFAILMDRRAAGLHPTYRAVREQANGLGDFINYFLHSEDTAYISRNAFIKVYKKAA